MFSSRLSDVTAVEVNAIFEAEVAESIDFEFKRELPFEQGKTEDPWMKGGKIGEAAKDILAKEIVAFANTGGGTLIVGVDENRSTKRAIPPLRPIPRCKEAAERLHQAVTARIEPKLPDFECEGIVTESDKTSGVVVMRTIQSYLAPHRLSSDNHCYIRRNDRAEPMSMSEIQEFSRRSGRVYEEMDRAFTQSGQRFYSWIPEPSRQIHPVIGIMGSYAPDASGSSNWTGLWAMRLTARPMAPLPVGDLPKQEWLKALTPETYNGSGRQGYLACVDLEVSRTWIPRLRAVEREFSGDHLRAVDRITTDGQIERFMLVDMPSGSRPKFFHISIATLVWNVASLIRMADTVRARSHRPSQAFALEIEFFTSDKLMITGYPGISPTGVQLIPATSVMFPRYEIGGKDGFDEILTVFDRDVWNLAGHHPNWQLSIDWPSPILK